MERVKMKTIHREQADLLEVAEAVALPTRNLRRHPQVVLGIQLPPQRNLHRSNPQNTPPPNKNHHHPTTLTRDKRRNRKRMIDVKKETRVGPLDISQEEAPPLPLEKSSNPLPLESGTEMITVPKEIASDVVAVPLINLVHRSYHPH